MHTTGTTTPDGVHQLAPGLGERRFMPPPSGGHFKLPAELQAPQTPQVAQVAHEPQAALPGHPVNLEGAAHMQVAAAVQQLAAQPPQVEPTRETYVGLPAAIQQVVGGLRPAEAQALQERFPSVAPNMAQHAAHRGLLPQAPPAPAGYQSAPMSVPPGMVPHTVQHAAPQGLSGMQPQGFMAVNTPGGFQPAMVPPTTTTNTTRPRPLGSMEVAPPTHTFPAPTAPWPPVQPHPLMPSPSTHPADVMPSVPAPHTHARATPTSGTVLRLEGPQDVIEAAIGMLMLRGLHVTVLPA